MEDRDRWRERYREYLARRERQAADRAARTERRRHGLAARHQRKVNSGAQKMAATPGSG